MIFKWLNNRGRMAEGGDSVESLAQDIDMTTDQPSGFGDRWGKFSRFDSGHEIGEGNDTKANQPGETYRSTGNHGHKDGKGTHYRK